MSNWVYRHFAADGELLYVGVSGNVEVRSYQHSFNSEWWPLVSRTETVEFPDRSTAEAAEAHAILAEQPTWNRRGKVERVAEPLSHAQQLLVIQLCVECSLFGSRSLAAAAPATDGYGERRQLHDAFLRGEVHGHLAGQTMHLNDASVALWRENSRQTVR